MGGEKILILTQGSRGDCQPFVALAHGLENQGFNVLLLSNPDHKTLCCAANVNFQSNGSSFRQVFTSERSRAAFKANNFIKFQGVIGDHLKLEANRVYTAVFAVLKDFAPDLVICGTLHQVDAYWIIKLIRIPCLIFQLSNSMTIDADEAPFGLPSLPCHMNALLWKLVFSKIVKVRNANVGPVLSRLSGKPAEDFMPALKDLGDMFGWGSRFSFVPYVIAAEGVVSTKKTDKPWFHFVGSLILPESTCTGPQFGEGEEAHLSSFLASGPAPVYIGWGELPKQPARL